MVNICHKCSIYSTECTQISKCNTQHNGCGMVIQLSATTYLWVDIEQCQQPQESVVSAGGGLDQRTSTTEESTGLGSALAAVALRKANLRSGVSEGVQIKRENQIIISPTLKWFSQQD